MRSRRRRGRRRRRPGRTRRGSGRRGRRMRPRRRSVYPRPAVVRSRRRRSGEGLRTSREHRRGCENSGYLSYSSPKWARHKLSPRLFSIRYFYLNGLFIQPCAFLRFSRSRLARRHHRLGARSGLRSRLVYRRSRLSWARLRSGLMYSGSRFAWLRPGLVYSGSRFAWLRSRLVYSRAGFAGLRTGLVYSGSRFAWLRPRFVYSRSGLRPRFRRGLMYPGLRPRPRLRAGLRSRHRRGASRHHRHRYERRRNFSRLSEKISVHYEHSPFSFCPRFVSLCGYYYRRGMWRISV